MDFPELDRDRFLKKEPSQTNQTKGAAYTAVNPKPKVGNDDLSKIGQPNRSQEDGGAPNVLTGTVITSCFIQTSALPSRIELAGNDITFFDDTHTENGSWSGDTARIVFSHASGVESGKVEQGFIIEKRASVFETYDNVLSIYSPGVKNGYHNFIFVGREALAGNEQYNVNTIAFGIDRDTSVPASTDPGTFASENGIFQIEYAEDGVVNTAAVPLKIGSSATLTGGALPNGFSAFIAAGNGGVVALAYIDSTAGTIATPIYLLDGTSVMLGGDLLPDIDNTYDIGSASLRIKDLYIAGTIHGGGLGGQTYAGIIDSGGGS